METGDPPHAATFRLDASRSHAAWAVAGAGAWWAGLVLFVHLAMGGGPLAGLATMLWFFWQFIGFVAAPYAVIRLDEALARRRGDHRPLRRPGLTAGGAFVGGIAGAVALVVALVTTGWRLPQLGGEWTLVAAMALGTWLGARLVAGRASDDVVTVGYDALRHRVGRRTDVVALRDITAVRYAPGAILVDVRGAPTLTIALRGKELDAHAIRSAIERAAEGARATFPAGAALRREGRGLEAWREALRAKVMGATDFRAQGVDRDDLEAALVHPGATAEERIGAALALRELDAAGATRVRVAAESAVAPALRDALRAVADGDADEGVVREATRASGEA